MNITAKTSTDTVATPTAVCFSSRDFSDPDFAVDDIVVVGVVVIGVVVVDVVVVVVGDVAAVDDSDGFENVVERSEEDSDEFEIPLELLELIESVVKGILVFTELLSVVDSIEVGVVIVVGGVVVVVVVVAVVVVVGGVVVIEDVGDVKLLVDDAVELAVVTS